jgi:tetratricopeptide (TPR) repeat protein
MIPNQQGYELSEFAWDGMQQAPGEKAPGTSKKPPTSESDHGAANAKEAGRYNERGTVKDSNGDFDGAIADYTRATELDPKFSEACYNRGLAKKHKGDFDGAIADYNHVIEANPNDVKFARAYCDRGVARRKKGDVDGAISDYNRTLDLDPKYSIAYLNRGNAKDEKGDTDGALVDYNRGIELNPANAKAYVYRADIESKKKQYAASIKDMEKAIALEPKCGPCYMGLGWYQIFNHKPRESMAASLKALKLSPDDALAINANLAHAYLFDNEFEKAKAIYAENKNRKLPEGDRTFAQSVLDDFKQFEQAGLTHPDLEKIKALMAAQ